MKARIFSFVLALIALFAFNDAFAQKKDPGQKANPQINTSQGEPELSQYGETVCIDYIRITGLGDATSVPAYLKIEGTATVCCYSPGQQKDQTPDNCSPGQKLSATGETVNVKVSNGNLIITTADGVCASLKGGCKNKNFESEISDVVITSVILVVQGKEFNLTGYL
jgi:hypothetical protein